MRIVHLSTSDTSGGAARSAHRLHRGLCTVGVDSSMFVRNRHSADESVYSFEPADDPASRLHRLWRYGRIRLAYAPYRLTRPKGLELFSDDRTRFNQEVVAQLPLTDIINLHWIDQFVDLGTFFHKTTAPIVWTLHDMNAFTGGCHYDVQCGRYTEACGHCPQLGSQREEDLSRAVWERKREAYQGAIQDGRLHVVAPSEWLAREARRSTLLGGAPVEVIPYGLDHTTFRRRSPRRQRRKLNIPEEHDVVLFVAQSTTNERKGFSLLAEALGTLGAEDVTLVSVGRDKPSIPGELHHAHAGRIEDDKKLARLYSMASVFVLPSRQDNLPNTVLESMACGTPVVGFDTGGVPDMVRPGETGWLAEKGDVRSLRENLETALENDSAREGMRKRCRQVVEEEYTLERQAKRYTALYDSILE